MQSSRVWVVVLLLLGASTLLCGQATGRIGGTLADPSGAAIPAATVICTDTNTSVKRTTETNGSGRFEFPELPIGVYALEFSKSGFETKRSENVQLVTGQFLDLNVSLGVRGSSQTVDVVESVPLVQTSSSSVQTTVDQKQMQDLPLNGRNPLQLTTLTPGAAITDVGTDRASRIIVG